MPDHAPAAQQRQSMSLTMYAFGHLLPSMTLREKLHSILHHSRFGAAWSAFQMVATVYACAQYVVETYSIMLEGARVVDLLISCIFLVDYVANWYAAPDWRIYPLRFMPMVDLCTIMPAFVMLLPGTGNIVSFLRVLRVVRSLRILRSFRMIGDNLRPSRRALAELALMCVSSLFIFATLFQLTETQFYGEITNNPDPAAFSDFKVDFGEAVYFGVIVLCTVGYGDLYAQTFWGKASTSALIVFTVFTFMSKISHFGSAWGARARCVLRARQPAPLSLTHPLPPPHPPPPPRPSQPWSRQSPPTPAPTSAAGASPTSSLRAPLCAPRRTCRSS